MWGQMIKRKCFFSQNSPKIKTLHPSTWISYRLRGARLLAQAYGICLVSSLDATCVGSTWHWGALEGRKKLWLCHNPTTPPCPARNLSFFSPSVASHNHISTWPLNLIILWLVALITQFEFWPVHDHDDPQFSVTN